MADYKFTQQSGDNWKVNTSDKADAYQDTNEIRAVIDELGGLLGHSLKDGSFPEDLASGGTLTDPTFTDSIITNTATSGDPHIILSENDVIKWDIYNDHADDALQIHSTTGVGLVMEIETGGNVIFSTGNVSIPGGQITFPATQNASTGVNTLDDYEEGSWTPALEFGGGSSGMSYNIQTGLYTKIGRKVSVTGYTNLSAKGTSSGNAIITGLPFTSKNVDGAFSAVIFSFWNITFANAFHGYISKNTTDIILQETTEAGNVSTINESNFANNSIMIFTSTYFTD